MEDIDRSHLLPPRRSMRRVHRVSRAAVWTLTLFGVVGICGRAIAHGPTIEISRQEMKPPLLNLYVGSTVHFVNTTRSPDGEGNVVVDASGTIESPTLAEPGDDWHYTFEQEGTFELFVRENPQAKSRVVIVPKR